MPFDPNKSFPNNTKLGISQKRRLVSEPLNGEIVCELIVDESESLLGG